MPYIGKNPTIGNFVKLDAITTSATATYNLTNGGVAYSPQSANHCLVSLNGVIQEPTSAGNVGGFTISGSTIVFTSALTSNDVIDFILVLGDVLNIGTPSDGTVGFSKVTSNLITGATAETSIDGADSVLIYDDSATALRKMTRTNFVSGLSNTPAFALRKAATQATVANANTLITWSNADIDTDSGFSNVNDSYTIPTGKDGIYNLSINISFDYGTRFIVMIFKNNSNFLAVDGEEGNNNAQIGANFIVNLSAGDVLTAKYYSVTSTGNIRFQNNAGEYITRFEGFKLI